MFDPNDPPTGSSGAPWTEGCPGCSFVADNIPHLTHLHARDTSFVMVSRAPLSKILLFKKRMGWDVPWYSSFGTDFNYDFHVTLDENRQVNEWNYEDAQVLLKKEKIPSATGEMPGLSAFLQDSASVFHTYSTYARGLEAVLSTFQILDLTAYGRQESWEKSPAGWPQVGTHSWLRHHDKYNDSDEKKKSCCAAGAAIGAS